MKGYFKNILSFVFTVFALLATASPSVVVGNTYKLPALPAIKFFDTYPIIGRGFFTINPKGLSTQGDFYNAYAKITTEVNFSPEELLGMKKVDVGKGKGRVLTLEELMPLVQKRDRSPELRFSLLAWANLDKKMLARLKSLPITNSVFNANQELASWFAYHGQMAERLADESLNLGEKNRLVSQYTSYAKRHKVSFGQKVAKAEQNDSRLFSLAKKAEAFTCGAFGPPNLYHFGGRVVYYLPCNWGIVETISPPCGGIFLFTYAGMAANPFIFQYGPWVIGNAILGKSSIIPGVCILGVPPAATYWPYEAVVIFYGAASAPGI